MCNNVGARYQISEGRAGAGYRGPSNEIPAMKKMRRRIGGLYLYGSALYGYRKCRIAARFCFGIYK